MSPNRSSPLRFVGKVLFGLLVAASVALVQPDAAAAQCAICGTDYVEDPWEPYPVIECMDFVVGMTECTMGIGWCYTYGDPCEWIMHLDFAEDGSAYVWREHVVPTDREFSAESAAAAVSETCDGVLLGLAVTAEDGAFSGEPISLEL